MILIILTASQYNEFYDGKLGRVLSADFINQLALKGQTSNPTCKPDTSTESTSPEYGSTSYTDHPEHSTATDAEVPESHFTTEDLPSTGSYHSTARSLDYNYDSSPVSSNGRNVEQNTANAIYMARNQQTNRIRRRNPSQRRRRENRRRRPTAQRRRRPSAQRRRRRNRNNSKDRRRRRREEQRKQPRRVIVRRRNANKRNNGQRNERSQL